ncbi:MAG TPA: lamin tail domain-containing protein [Propionibacteriaceae bacterium]|nr:lamin tail domain-containing protein [Propionibacteriaceae bacterium]
MTVKAMLARIVGVAVCGVAAATFIPASAEAASAIQLGKIYYNSPGSDTGSNTSLNAEYVVIKNTGTTNRSLTGWTLRDAQGHVYKFGTFTLYAGKSVTVHTGKGSNTASHRYMQRGWYVWNNTGDKATVRRADGVWIDSCSWTSSGLGYKYC